MNILTIRTDKPEAELGLYEDDKELGYETWQAHRRLAETIHTKISDLLVKHGLEIQQIDAVACYQGPGSFTGLRIGLSVANAFAAGLQVPITGGSGDTWRKDCIRRLTDGKNDMQILPEYGAPVHITKPRK